MHEDHFSSDEQPRVGVDAPTVVLLGGEQGAEARSEDPGLRAGCLDASV